MRKSPSPWTPERRCFLKVRIRSNDRNKRNQTLSCICVCVCSSDCVRRPGARPSLSPQNLCIPTLRLRTLPSPRGADQRQQHVEADATRTPAQDDPVGRRRRPGVRLLPRQPPPGRPRSSPEHQRASGEAADILLRGEERRLSQDAAGGRHTHHTLLRQRPPGRRGEDADVTLRPAAPPAQRGAERRTRQEDDVGRVDPARTSRTPGERVQASRLPLAETAYFGH